MEALAYLHLSAAYESPAIADFSLVHDNSTKLAHETTLNFLCLAATLTVLGTATQASALLQSGDKGPEVFALQDRLHELGYFNRLSTGYFREVTQAAVIRFQEDNQINADGIVGSETEAALFGSDRSTNPISNPVAQIAADKTAGNSQPLLQIGDRSSDDVRRLQEKLAEVGYNPGEIDSKFGLATERAVKQFQRDRQLTVNGTADSQTWDALLNNISPVQKSLVNNSLVLQKGDRSQDVSYLQRLLREKGFNPGIVDGVFGSRTEAAVKEFQSEQGLVIDGKARPETLQALGCNNITRPKSAKSQSTPSRSSQPSPFRTDGFTRSTTESKS